MSITATEAYSCSDVTNLFPLIDCTMNLVKAEMRSDSLVHCIPTRYDHKNASVLTQNPRDRMKGKLSPAWTCGEDTGVDKQDEEIPLKNSNIFKLRVSLG